MNVNERAFEDVIESSLLEVGGYRKGNSSGFDAGMGLDPDEVFSFVMATQPKAWSHLLIRYGNDESSAKTGVLTRFVKQIDERGILDVLRHGVTDHGIELKLAYFKPAHRLTFELEELYQANRLMVIRQFRYESV